MGFIIKFKAGANNRTFYVSDPWGENASKKKSEAHVFTSAVGARKVANSLVRYGAQVVHADKGNWR